MVVCREGWSRSGGRVAARKGKEKQETQESSKERELEKNMQSDAGKQAIFLRDPVPLVSSSYHAPG
jgi:hypothetical protein